MKRMVSLLIACFVLHAAAGAAKIKPAEAADQKAVVEGNNAFAVDLYAQLRSQPGNLFFSPESISTALSMAYAGARGDTAAEMAKTLHFTLPPDHLHPAMGALLSDLNAAHNGYQLRVADALWAQRDYVFLNDFLKLTKSDYGAGFNQVDFKGATEAARLTINQWIEQKTGNKITNLLQPGVLDSLTKMVLTNAIYFKGDWRTPFVKAWTEDDDFHLSPARNVKAPLMHLTEGFDYLDGGTFQALEIPYEGGDLSMIVFLPRDIDGLPALEQSLTASSMKQWLDQLHPVPEVILTLPKFKMTRQFNLQNTLGAMGMKRAFDANAADFSGMSGNRELFISAVIHKAFVDVDEKGTEAAAATAMVMEGATARPPRFQPPPPPVFRADHPFVFLIRDNRSGGILFMGRVTDPTK
jgi:serpin B